MFHWLVGGAVFTQTNGVMGIDMDGANVHQCTHAHRIAGIVGEHQEGGIKRNEATVQRQTITDCGHAKFAHTGIDVIGIGIGAGNRLAPLPCGEV